MGANPNKANQAVGFLVKTSSTFKEKPVWNRVRPDTPGPGQESVWDYPRPPRLEPVKDVLRVIFNGEIVAESKGGFRVLETSHPPVFYIPPSDIAPGVLEPASGRSMCEFKGIATYWTVVVKSRTTASAAWSYADPTPAFERIRDHLAFYASKVDECWVGNERVAAQEGDFYGGWITSKVVGPFKGAPGTRGW